VYVRHTRGGALTENFTSTSGWIRVTHSEPDRVEGEFRVMAELFCAHHLLDPYPDAGCDRSRPLVGVSPLVISGSFVARMHDKDEVRTDDIGSGIT
jgi:hypothetical protein